MDTEFIEALSTKSSFGGGSAAAYAGVLAAACTMKVCNLIIGKKRYEGYEELFKSSLEQLELYRDELIDLIYLDANAFDMVMAKFNVSDDEKDDKINAIINACEIPFKIMEACKDIMTVNATLVNCVSKLVVSDLGVSTELAMAAIKSASLNVYINSEMLYECDDTSAMFAANEFRCNADDFLEKSKFHERYVWNVVKFKIE